MFIPKPYQTECLAKIEYYRQAGHNKALIVMASGLGKTVTIGFDVKKWLETNQGRVLYLCHQNDILSQAKTTFESILGPNYSYGFLHGNRKDIFKVNFLFSSLQTMEKYTDFFGSSEFDFIIVDESHHSRAETYQKTIEYFRPKFLLGATATPDRGDELDIRSIYGQEIFYLPLEEAVLQNLLTPVEYFLLTDEIEIPDDLQTEDGKKITIKYLNRRLFIPKRDEEIARLIYEHANNFSKKFIIVFCPSITYCDHLAQFLPDSLSIHSKIPLKERDVRLELFRQGIVSTILTVDCFNEGIDIPQANVIVFLRSTLSPTVFLQQLGRGLRKSAGKDKVVVLDFVGNCEHIKMVYDLWKNIHEKYTSDFTKEHSQDTISDMEPFMLDIGNINFQKKIMKIIDIINNKIKVKFISDYPHLLAEYSSRNKAKPGLIPAGTGNKIWWQCSKCSHEWQATGNNRVRGNGCPACLNKVVTANNNLAVTHPDLAIEYSSKNKLPASQVFAGTGNKIWWQCLKCNYEWQAKGDKRVAGSGCPACSNRVVTANNNLAVTHPDLAIEYSSKNKLPANQVFAGTKYKLWWQCSKCSHEWQARGHKRVAGNGCPSCSNKVVTANNNLAVTHPDLAREYSRKNKLPASKVLASTRKKLWWQCSKCSHEWQATGSNRSNRGSNCPRCREMSRHLEVTNESREMVARLPLIKSITIKRNSS